MIQFDDCAYFSNWVGEQPKVEASYVHMRSEFKRNLYRQQLIMTMQGHDVFICKVGTWHVFQVPKMEVLNLMFRLFWGWVFPYISRIHTAYIREDSSIFGT